ncbi:MAG: carboxylesterase/lipase family protein, partial [Hyphomicrobiales bacterium]
SLTVNDAETLFAAYEAAHPNAVPIDVFKHLRSDALFRMGTIHAAQHKVQQSGASLYKYCFAWKSPVLNGMLGASHTLEIPFVFGNTDLTPEIIGHAPDRHEVTRQAMGYWVNFARTGNPNGAGLPDWPAYTLERRDTMVINRTCQNVPDYRGKARELSQVFYA